MITKTYKIANIIIRIITDFDYIEDKRYKEFVYKCNEDPADFVIRWEACIEPPLVGDKIIEIDGQGYYANDNTMAEVYPDRVNMKPFRWLFFEKDSSEKTQTWRCYYLKEKKAFFKYTSIIFRHIGFPIMLNLKKIILLHSSFIKLENKGILFSGPSGIGKSTQAALWEKIEKAEIINGDRAIIKKENQIWSIYGLPYAGSSNCFRNESAELKAIVFLSQSKENRIRQLKIGEAYRNILMESYHILWDDVLRNNTLNVIEEMINAVPAYLLDCTPDEKAVMCLKKKLMNKGDLV